MPKLAALLLQEKETIATTLALMSGVFEEVHALVRRIPKGKVATYGQLSRMIDKRLTPVGIGWALRAVRDVPWQRVVNAQGGLSTEKSQPGVQRKLLGKEGVRFRKDGTIDLAKYGWGFEAVQAPRGTTAIVYPRAERSGSDLAPSRRSHQRQRGG